MYIWHAHCAIPTVSVRCVIPTVGVHCVIPTVGVHCVIRTVGVHCVMPTLISIITCITVRIGITSCVEPHPPLHENPAMKEAAQ